MNKTVGRILAETDIRALSVSSASQSTEAFTHLRDNLDLEMGDMMKVRPVLDKAGLDALKNMT